MTDNRPDDDILDERIRALASAQYHAPEGSVPRDAMWAQIAAARRAARAAGAPAEAPRAADVVPLVSRRPRTRALVWSALLAAGLVLGIAIERTVLNDHGIDRSREIARVDSTHDTSTRLATTQSMNPDRSEPSSASTAPSTHAAGTTPEHATEPRRSTDAPRRDVRTSPQYAAAEPRDLAPAPDSTVETLYRAAAVQTLRQAEALLTAYRGAASTSRDPQAMQQAARWARDVLSSTRLLIDSPAGRDPQMHALFTDLELILAQIVQLSGTPLQASERELIDRAMRDRDLLPRLRSAVPAGLATS